LKKKITAETSKLQEKPSSIKREHPALQKMIANPDAGTDPGTPMNPDPIRIRIHNIDFDDPEPGLVLYRVRRLKIGTESSDPDSAYIIPNTVCMKNSN
jgi:hypothetical protein